MPKFNSNGNPNDFATVMYAASPVCIEKDDRPGCYTFSIYTIPKCPFEFGSKEYWSWWRGYVSGNNTDGESIIDAIRKDYEEK